MSSASAFLGAFALTIALPTPWSPSRSGTRAPAFRRASWRRYQLLAPPIARQPEQLRFRAASGLGVRIDCALLDGTTWDPGTTQAGGFEIEEESEAARVIREGREELDERAERWKEGDERGLTGGSHT